MDVADRDLVRGLLTERRLLALGTVIDGEPFVSQVPFAVRADHGSLLVHVSSLARHSRGLVEGARYSALIQADSSGDDDPFQIPRLTLTGAVRVLPRGTDEYGAARAAYLEALPSGQVTFSLGDFRLIELVVEKARLVAGFARTANLTAGMLKQALAEGSSAAAETEILAEARGVGGGEE